MQTLLHRLVMISGLAAVAMTMTGCVISDEADLQKIINNYGFSRNIPASTLYGPGAFVARERYDPKESLPPKSAQLTSLCIPRYSIDLYPEKPQESPLESFALNSAIGGSFTLGAPVLKSLFKLNATAKAARTVTASISDSKVFAFSDEDFLRIRKLLGPECRSIINENAGKKNAYQVRRVLQATLKLKVDLDAKISANAKAIVVKELASAGFELDPLSSTVEVTGKALYYGVLIVPIDSRV
jgi:hypothetical protein